MDSLIQINLDVVVKHKIHKCGEDILGSYEREDFWSYYVLLVDRSEIRGSRQWLGDCSMAYFKGKVLLRC